MKRKYTEETKQKIAEATRKREAARKKAEAANPELAAQRKQKRSEVAKKGHAARREAEAADPLLEMANKQQRSEAARKGHATRGKKRQKTKFHNCSDDHSLADQSYGSVGDNHSLSGVSWRDRSSSVPTNIITRN